MAVVGQIGNHPDLFYPTDKKVQAHENGVIQFDNLAGLILASRTLLERIVDLIAPSSRGQPAPKMRCCLTDFTPVRMALATPQELTLELGAFVAARTWCLRNGVIDEKHFADQHRDLRQKFARYGLSASVIKARELVFFPPLEDIILAENEVTIAEPKQRYRQLFDNYQELIPKNIYARHESYALIAEDCLERMFSGIEIAPDDLIHVTCSGYLAPSPVERMAVKKGWLSTTVTNSYHMGCYGAFPAIRMAHGFLASSQIVGFPAKNRVDIVHTEILSAHADAGDVTPEGIITKTLFADGFIKYSAVTENELKGRGLVGLKVLAFAEHLLADSSNDMTWTPGPHCFKMSLSFMVPVRIKSTVKKFVNDLLERAGINYSQERERLVFAIHPGGPKIIEHLQSELNLSDEQVELSKKIFLENGNMSSATVPHILKAIIDEPYVPLGARIVAIGFGPGLTASGLVLQKI
jgi:alkylresorcinol/alkylpyrone synthase